MKRFIVKLLIYSISLAVLCGIFLILPTPPKHTASLYFAALQKDSLLEHTPAPRIIFVGGSNVNFGLNSQIIKDSLGLNPINTAINAEIGLKYMLDNTRLYLHSGDIVVLIPNYEQFFRDYNHVSYELAFSVYEVDLPKVKLFNFKQINNSIQYVGQFFNSKITLGNYFYAKNSKSPKERPLYAINSFNKYGDTDAHWDRTISQIPAYETFAMEQYEPQAMAEIKKYDEELKKLNCRLLISYPVMEINAYHSVKNAIDSISKDYQKYNLEIVGTPEKYVLPDSLIFNCVYHPLKSGVDKYTLMLAEDLKKALTE
ncbi:MAG: hypothetical protein LBV75_00485 [Paludibacter sp.]|nr:hypothetical protein [Paludibacter sp.]